MRFGDFRRNFGQALAAKVAEMGGEEAMKIAFEKFDTDGVSRAIIAGVWVAFFQECQQ